MRRFYGLRALVLSLVFVLLLGGCSGGGTKPDSGQPAPAQEKPKEKIVLKLGHTGAPDPNHYYQAGCLKFADLVKEKTNGQVEVQVFPADQLGKQRELVEGAQIGTVDMVLTSTMILGNFDELIQVFDMPFLFTSREEAYKVLDGPVGQECADRLEKKGLKILAYWENGFRHITNSVRPIEKPSDLKGLKLRVPESAVSIDTFTTLGAAATPIAMGELFSALQLKTVDGQENPAGHIITQRFFEVQKYVSLTGHIYTPEPLVISKMVWDGLAPDIQKAIQEAAIEARDYERKVSQESEESYLKQIEEKGMIISRPNVKEFQAAVQPVYDKYADKYGEILKKIREALKS